MKLHSCFALYIACQLTMVTYASAQSDDSDPFGETDEMYGDIADPEPDPSALTGPYVPPAETQGQAPNSDPTMAAQSLFGIGGEPAYGAVPKSNPRWGNINSNAGGERIEDTYEMRMKEELGKPLPKRAPFGDQMNEIDSRFKPKPKL